MAKVQHRVIVALLIVQYVIGWVMPNVRRGQPGTSMALHISLGILILLLIVVRLGWRLTHPVASDSTLSRQQRITSGAVHWLLYLMVLATALSGWLFTSFRDWSVQFFFLFPLPMLWSRDASGARAINGLHQILEWSLLALIGVHVASALVHLFIFRDKVMQRMLPG